MMNMTPNPTMVPARKRLIPSGNLRDLQALYQTNRKSSRPLGTRNPKTLSGAEPGNESVTQNDVSSKAWTTVRKLVQAGRSDRHIERAARVLG